MYVRQLIDLKQKYCYDPDMKKNKPKRFHTPFNNLPSRLKQKPSVLKEEGLASLEKVKSEINSINKKPIDDSALFLNAMADVVPISRGNIVDTPPQTPKANNHNNPSDEFEIINKLNRLVDQGIGYIVSATPEYIEGTGYNVHPEISKRLHKGKFSIQAHIDLHGMTVSEARPAFDAFLKSSISRGYRALLVIHGRGLSSPDRPVLKPKVYEWLTHSPWNKWIIAFSSAKPYDGGAGATYILLRKNPISKRFRKKRHK